MFTLSSHPGLNCTKRAMCLTPSSLKRKDELKLEIKSLKWNIGRWQRTGCNLPLRVAVGRSSATCRRVWASHWPGTPSTVSPLWQGPCPSRPGSTEAWLREQKHTPVKISDEKQEDSFRKEQNDLIKYAASKIIRRKAWLTAQISGSHKKIKK